MNERISPRRNFFYQFCNNSFDSFVNLDSVNLKVTFFMDPVMAKKQNKNRDNESMVTLRDHYFFDETGKPISHIVNPPHGGALNQEIYANFIGLYWSQP